MVVVKRNDCSGSCQVVAEDIEWSQLSSYLESIRQEYVKEGWLDVWDDERLRKSLTLSKEGECFTYTYYWKRMPRRKKEFLW